jgi:hypothetical protein
VDKRGGFQIFGIQWTHTIDLLGALDIEFVCRMGSSLLSKHKRLVLPST